MFATSHINHLHQELEKSCSLTNNQVKSSTQSKVKSTLTDFFDNIEKSINHKHITIIPTLSSQREQMSNLDSLKNE